MRLKCIIITLSNLNHAVVCSFDMHNFGISNYNIVSFKCNTGGIWTRVHGRIKAYALMLVQGLIGHYGRKCFESWGFIVGMASNNLCVLRFDTAATHPWYMNILHAARIYNKAAKLQQLKFHSKSDHTTCC